MDDVVGEKGVFDDVIASLKEDPDGPQIDVESDLIACLGKRIVLLGDYEEPIDIDSDRLVIAVEATDPEKVAPQLAKVWRLIRICRIEAHGVVIWELIDRSMEIPTLEIETPAVLLHMQTRKKTAQAIVVDACVKRKKNCSLILR